ncbi:MAG: YkgJ family cysteine cluster protein [Chitinivibrionales bacterium]|nr:YkgJ family cysteine cluster protein [Chitinivibrionales bacterium]
MTDSHVKEMAKGLLFLHNQISDTTKNSILTTSFLYGLIELLSQKGIISIEELDEKKREIAQRLVERHSQNGLGLMYQDPEMDKYAFEKESVVDCGKMHHQCKAICCKIPFALSRQDVEEGIVQWDFGRPYAIAHGDDGYCVHVDRKTYKCTIHKNRPIPCRGFDCRSTERWNVWVDSENGIVDPSLCDKIKESVRICYGQGGRAISCRKERQQSQTVVCESNQGDA